MNRSKAIAPVKASAEWLQDSENNWIWTENGNEVTGWKQVDGTWYHFDANGKMQTGWVKAEDSKWYYMNTNGAMKTGWLKDSDGKWYNLAPSRRKIICTCTKWCNVDWTKCFHRRKHICNR